MDFEVSLFVDVGTSPGVPVLPVVVGVDVCTRFVGAEYVSRYLHRVELSVRHEVIKQLGTFKSQRAHV